MIIRLISGWQCLPAVLILLLLNSVPVGAENKVPAFFTFTFENDAVVDEDDGYTNGLGLTFGKGPFKEFDNNNLPSWLYNFTKDFYISTMQNKQRAVAHMFFQRMQTPGDISETELIVDDLPYAALLSWQGTLYAWDDQVSDQFSLVLGFVGPIALGEQTQSLVHKLTGANDPNGWDNQLENEPVFKIEALQVWNLYRSAGRKTQYDLLGLTGAGIGNLESAAKAGFAIRWGTNLRLSFPSFSLEVSRQINPLALSPNNDFYLFLGARAGVVFNNILVDGNTFKDSHSVPLEHFQDQLSTGVVWNSGKHAFVFQISSISSPTEVISDRDKFGALSYTRRF